MIVYLILNTINGKSYVGQSINPLKKRWIQHKSAARRGKTGSVLYDAIRKYGENTFEVSILAETDSLLELNTLEIEHIAKQGALAPSGYNLTTGGNSFSATARSPEVYAKISAALMGNTNTLGHKLSPEHRAKLTGRKRSAEARTRISVSLIGHPVLSETKLKISAALKGNTHTKGRVFSPEHKAKMIAARKARRVQAAQIDAYRKIS